MLLGFEAEMSELCIGTLPELFDGNPPYKGHGGMSFAMSVAEILRTLATLKKMDAKIAAENENKETIQLK